jgi:MerT mercuric transport protein
MSRSKRGMGRSALGTAALVSALGFALSWMCCILPLAIFGSLGVTTAALGAWLEPYRSYLQGASVLALAAVFLIAYLPRRRGEECGEGGVCARRHRGRLAAWFFAGAVLLLLTSPYWVGLITYWTT